MHSHHPRHDSLLQLLWFLTKVLFGSMFVFTTACVLAAVFGASAAAWAVYLLIWPIFWRSCVTLLCLFSVAVFLDSLN